MASTGKAATNAVQQSLFADIPLDAAPDTTGMVRMATPPEGAFPPLQRKFNNLAEKIEGLRRSIEERTSTYDEILAHWSKKLAPLFRNVADMQTALASAIEKQANGFKLGVRQREAVGIAITGLLTEAFSLTEPGEEAQALFTRWSDTSFEEEVEIQGQEMTEAMSDAIREGFGIDIDAEALRKGPEAIEEALMEALLKAQEDFERTTKPRKKTAKQIAKEERERIAEEHAKKGLRSLYLSLVKVLHPDIERDAVAREAKEGTMKELTAAYEAGDLHTLLRIEMEWIARETRGNEPLPEDRLKAYVSVLAEQVEELEEELAALDYSPRYMPIACFLDIDAEWAKDRIDDECRHQHRADDDDPVAP